MNTSVQDVSFVLDDYDLDCFADKETKEKIINGVAEVWRGARTSFGMADKLIAVFQDIANFELSKKTAKKIGYDISCQMDLSYTLKDLLSCEVLKDKLTVDRKQFVITLKVHDDFVVKSYLNKQKTYINDKFYYDIEDQDLLECYCAFVQDNGVYVLYSKRRALSYIGLANRYLKMSDMSKIEKLKKNKNVQMIFTNKELIYARNK